MSSIRDQLIDAVVAKLNGAGKPAKVEAIRYSLSKIDFKPDPTKKFLMVYPEKDQVSPPDRMFGMLKRTLRLCVDAYSLGEPIDENLDPALCWITTALSSDDSLGGLALDVRHVSEEWSEAFAQEGIGMCRSLWDIEYTQLRSSQERQS